MFKRLWMVLRSWLGAGIEKLEDPELLLQQAQEEMRTMHAKNRMAAVEAITSRTEIATLLLDTEQKISRLRQEAAVADQLHDGDRAARLSTEADRLSVADAAMLQRMEDAIRVADEAKAAIRREDEKIPEATKEALRLKAEWLKTARSGAGIGLSATPGQVVFLIVLLDCLLLALLLLSFLR